MNPSTFCSEPRYLTPNERCACIEWLATLSLAELHTRQSLCSTQILIAYGKQNTNALENLRITEEDLMRAVMLKCFGESL